jgi:hypothetical protein
MGARAHVAGRVPNDASIHAGPNSDIVDHRKKR